jgi:hypothetical protein
MLINFMRNISSKFNMVLWNVLSGLRVLIGPILFSITVWVSFPAIILSIKGKGKVVPVLNELGTTP